MPRKGFAGQDPLQVSWRGQHGAANGGRARTGCRGATQALGGVADRERPMTGGRVNLWCEMLRDRKAHAFSRFHEMEIQRLQSPNLSMGGGKSKLRDLTKADI